MGDVARPPLYDDPERYDLLAELTAPADLPFCLGLVERFGGPVLELGCGTGRIAVPLAASGVDVAGIDISAPMIAAARRRAAASGVACELRVGDLRDFELMARFALVLLPYNTFNHLLDLEDQRRCFAAVERHLAPGAVFVIDTFHPDPSRLAVGGSEPERLVEYIDPRTGRRLHLTEVTRYDPVRQINVATRRTWSAAGELLVEDVMRFRVVFPAELDALLALSGFEVVEKFGGYDGEPFGACSAHQIVLCRRG